MALGFLGAGGTTRRVYRRDRRDSIQLAAASRSLDALLSQQMTAARESLLTPRS